MIEHIHILRQRFDDVSLDMEIDSLLVLDTDPTDDEEIEFDDD